MFYQVKCINSHYVLLAKLTNVIAGDLLSIACFPSTQWMKPDSTQQFLFHLLKKN